MADVRRLPTPVTSVWEWQMRGACRDLDTAFFFHPERERGPSRTRREHQAKQICAGCPVQEQCRAHALSVHEPYGVWGGLTETERVAIHRSAIRPVDTPGEARSGGGAHRDDTWDDAFDDNRAVAGSDVTVARTPAGPHAGTR